VIDSVTKNSQCRNQQHQTQRTSKINLLHLNASMPDKTNVTTVERPSQGRNTPG
jgi:hypothetical protein